MPEAEGHIIDLIERLGRIARGARHAEGMKPAQWEALRFLAHANKLSRTPGALADFLSSTRGTVSQTLIALEKKGLVKRTTSTGDGRVKQLELTADGHAVVRRDPLNTLEDALREVDDKDGLASSLERILGNIIRQNGNHQFGVCQGCRHFAVDAASDHAKGPHKCLLIGEPLNSDDSHRICRAHEAHAA